MKNNINIVYDNIHGISIAAFLNEKNAADFVRESGLDCYQIKQFEVAQNQHDNVMETISLVLKGSSSDDEIVATFFEIDQAEEFAGQNKEYFVEVLIVEDSNEAFKAKDDWGFHSDGEYLFCK